MKLPNITSPEDQRVTFVELFFDLVFVFSVTQVVGLLHHELNWRGVGQAILVFWLVWWAWTQFTWALNAGDTTHPLIELGALAATAVAFFMAVALPDAFHGRALWFAAPYVLVRVIGLTLYTLVAAADSSLQMALRRFAVLSISGLLAVLVGGVLGGAWQYLFWALAIVLDVAAAAIGGQADGWNLHPDHFSERHGLFVIIALGETLIVAAGGVTGAAWTSELIAAAIMAVAVTCALWWCYFIRAKPMLDHALENATGANLAMMARDVFSLLHFPMLCGVIAFAVAIEEIVIHPAEPLPVLGRMALAIGLALFVGGAALAIGRATGRIPIARVVLIGILLVLLPFFADITPALTLLIAFVILAAIAIWEQRSASVVRH
ncbi:MAG: low temperature requirement protein A [Caldilineaceae bacterium]